MLNILSGLETGNVKSFPIAAGVKLDEGDWVVFNGNGELTKQTGTFAKVSGVTFPVYAGNARFYDTRSLNRVDVVTAKSVVLESNKVAAVTLKAGDPLTVKDGVIDKAEADANIIGYAIEAAKNGVLKFILA